MLIGEGSSLAIYSHPCRENNSNEYFLILYTGVMLDNEGQDLLKSLNIKLHIISTAWERESREYRLPIVESSRLHVFSLKSKDYPKTQDFTPLNLN